MFHYNTKINILYAFYKLFYLIFFFLLILTLLLFVFALTKYALRLLRMLQSRQQFLFYVLLSFFLGFFCFVLFLNSLRFVVTVFLLS